MNETKLRATPGPWHYDQENNAIYNKTCLYICDAPKNNDHDKHLIAAAPDLYEALEITAELVEALGHTAKKARVALAKARGGNYEY